MKVKQAMTPSRGKAGKITVNQDESIDNAALLMKENNLKSITAVDDDNRVVGKVTRKDIIEVSDDLNEDFLID